MKERVTITIDKDLLEFIKKQARERHISLSAYVALAIQKKVK